MGAELKPIGRAVATAKGHYPLPDGRHVTVQAGETFTVFEGLDKAKWFTVLEDGAPAPTPAAPEVAPPEPDTLSAVATRERKRRAEAKPPTSDEIA